jgi:hypothetical protein
MFRKNFLEIKIGTCIFNSNLTILLEKFTKIYISPSRHSVLKVNDKILDVSKMWQIERLQLKNHYKLCRMVMSALNMMIITK